MPIELLEKLVSYKVEVQLVTGLCYKGELTAVGKGYIELETMRASQLGNAMGKKSEYINIATAHIMTIRKD